MTFASWSPAFWLRLPQSPAVGSQTIPPSADTHLLICEMGMIPGQGLWKPEGMGEGKGCEILENSTPLPLPLCLAMGTAMSCFVVRVSKDW